MKQFIPSLAFLRVHQTTLWHLLQVKRNPSASEKIKVDWSRRLLDLLKINLEIKGSAALDPGMLFLGNHISYLDIPLLMLNVPKVSFVAKAELQTWPIFGEGAKAANTIFVKRESNASRSRTLLELEKSLFQGKRIALFPSGTTTLSESKAWKRGAFHLAKQLNIKIQPFRIAYSPLRTAAYIDDDFFPAHLNQLTRQKKGLQAFLEFHPPVNVDNVEESRVQWQRWCGELQHTQQLLL